MGSGRRLINGRHPAAIALTASAAGCSFLFVKPPPENVEHAYELSCSKNPTAPAIDVLVTGAEGFRTVYALSASEADYKGIGLDRTTDIAIGTAFVLVYAASAIYGSYEVQRCQKILAPAPSDKRPARSTLRLRPPVIAPPAVPAGPAAPEEAEPPSGSGPLSPGQVARIAPFTKRRYASPAECQASCPTGECLPYRGENGAAMACIVRCKVDSQCPQGFACNCPESGGPNCRQIAKVPGDPMAGFCLSIEPDGGKR
jgi:hypothetical protein